MFYSCSTLLNFLAAVKFYFMNDRARQLKGLFKALCNPIQRISVKKTNCVAGSYWHEQETQIAVHTHGEDAIDQVIKAYDKVCNTGRVGCD